VLPNAFAGSARQPNDEELTAQLGRPARAVWDRLIRDLADEYGVDVQEWSSYSRKAGWSLRLKRGQRTILYLSPSRGSFLASFALGRKALEAARQSGLPPKVTGIIAEARRYAEGTAVRLDVAGAEDIASVKKLAAAKLAN
jgi:hypothetical protein